MPIDDFLLEILACPVSKQPLAYLSREQLAKLNAAIAEQQVCYVGGESVDEPLTEGLITRNRSTIYRIDDGIPIMLEEKGIATIQLSDLP